MPLIVLFLLLFAIDFYAFQAIQLAMSGLSKWVNIGITIIYWLIPIGLILSFIFFRKWFTKNGKEGSFRMIRSLFFLVYFSKFILLLLLLLGNLGGLILLGVTYISKDFSYAGIPSILFSQISILTAGIPLIMLIYGILRNRHRYKLFKETIPIPNLPKNLEGLKIVQISDIHSGSFTRKEPLKKGIQLINDQAADLVFFTGDLVNSTAREIEPYLDVFNKIKAKYGVFSILGNHDYGDYVRWPSKEVKKNNLAQLKNTQKQLGWQLLLNENRLLNINGQQIAIIGVENYSANARFSKYGDLAKAYEGSQNVDLKLLLSHDPSHWEAQVTNNFKDIAITFSGHTHGAQFGIEISGIFKWSPVQYFYKQWAGLYQKGSQYLYVNRGFGYLAYPGRVGILPEITAITLVRKV